MKEGGITSFEDWVRRCEFAFSDRTLSLLAENFREYWEWLDYSYRQGQVKAEKDIRNILLRDLAE